MKRLFLTATLVASALLSAASSAQATFVSYGSAFGFGRITSNHPEDVGPFLSVQLGSDTAAPGYAAFRFDFAPTPFSTNPEIAAIYLEDGAYSQNQLFAGAPGSIFSPNPFFDQTQSSSGTQFGVGTPSPGLPGAGSLNHAFVNRDGFLASSTVSSVNVNSGINGGEHALFFVKLNSGVTLADVLEALNHPFGGEYGLRFGLREVNDAGGTGDGYVNLHAPEPATVGVWAIGMAVFGCVAAWRRKTASS